MWRNRRGANKERTIKGVQEGQVLRRQCRWQKGCQGLKVPTHYFSFAHGQGHKQLI